MACEVDSRFRGNDEPRGFRKTCETQQLPFPILQARQQPLQRLRVDHVRRRCPATARGGDAEMQELQVFDIVRVGVDRQLDAGFDGFANMLVLEVQPVRVCVDLQYGAGALCGLDDGIDIEVEGLALLDDPASWMKQDVGVRVLDGAQHAARLLSARQAEVRVHRDANHVELGQGLVVDVEAAVFVDIDFGAREDGEAAELPVELADRRHLLPELFLV